MGDPEVTSMAVAAGKDAQPTGNAAFTASPPVAGQSLALENISHRYGSALAVADVSLAIKGGELVALLGPSGCGKTTLLRIIAGFVLQSSGRVVVGNRSIDDLPPHRREVGIVFQNYALFPHMNAAENIGYGLAARGVSRTEQRSRVAEMLALVKMEGLGDRYPKELSGGQQQRVALARALAVRPRILLLDEPFAALDKALRLDMQIEVKRIQRLARTTTVLVTHDQEEALSMADRVAVLNQGRLEQFGGPAEVYDAPRTLFVNSFVGSTNVLRGVLVSDGGTPVMRTDDGVELRARAPQAPIAPGGRVVACVRPEHLRFVDDGPGIAGVVEMSLPLGSAVIHEVRTRTGVSLKVSEQRSPGRRAVSAGAAVTLAPISPELVNVYSEATTGSGSQASSP